MRIKKGFPEAQRDRVAGLYWAAFADKLGIVLAPQDRGIALIRAQLDPDYCLSALSDEGAVLGVVGFKSYSGAFAEFSFEDLRGVFGLVGATWRSLALSLLERDVENSRFLMDGIFTAPEARGQGVGTALLDAMTTEAARMGFAEIRLDVVDTNPRARALYERRGFKAIKTQGIGPLRHLFGFRTATTMVRPTGLVSQRSP